MRVFTLGDIASFSWMLELYSFHRVNAGLFEETQLLLSPTVSFLMLTYRFSQLKIYVDSIVAIEGT
jgi:hypothetical protein